jgi:ribosomal protein L40E
MCEKCVRNGPQDPIAATEVASNVDFFDCLRCSATNEYGTAVCSACLHPVVYLAPVKFGTLEDLEGLPQAVTDHKNEYILCQGCNYLNSYGALRCHKCDRYFRYATRSY